MEQQATYDQQGQTSDIVTLVLTADNHLGYAIPGQHPRKRKEMRQQLRRAFQQAADFAIGQGVDLFVQAGDLFDTTNPDEQDRSFVAERLAQLRQAGIRTFALGGVHDTPADTQVAPQISYARLGALHYFPPGAGAEMTPVLLNVRGTMVGICGLGILAGQQGDPLAYPRVHNDIERAAISILILHAPIEGLADSSSLLDTQARVSRASIANQSAFRTILAGFHHGYQHFSIGRTEIIVAGSSQHIDFNDPAHDPGFVFLGLAADGTRWCRHISVDALQVRLLVIQASDPTLSTESILGQLRPLCTANAMVQLRLEGELTRQHYHQLDLNQVRRFGEEQAFAFAIDDSALSFLPEQEAVSIATGLDEQLHRDERLSAREELLALADEWIAAAQDEEERKALQATKEELLAALWKL